MAGKQNDGRMCLLSYLYAHNAADKALQYVSFLSLLCQTFYSTKITWGWYATCLDIRQNNWQSWQSTFSYELVSLSLFPNQWHKLDSIVVSVSETSSKINICVLGVLAGVFLYFSGILGVFSIWDGVIATWDVISKCPQADNWWICDQYSYFLDFISIFCISFWKFLDFLLNICWHKCVHRRVNGADNWWIRDQYSAANVISPQGGRD